MNPLKPEDVNNPQPIKSIGEEKASSGMPSQSFETFMQKEVKTATPLTKPVTQSPFDLPQMQNPLTKAPTVDALLSQAKAAQAVLGDLNTQLQTPNLKLKQSQRYLLRNKLTDANAHLRSANMKLGAEPPPPPAPTAAGPMGRFLDFLSEGESNIQLAQQQLNKMKDKGDSINPADFLAVQLKISHAQQEIEYASIMLSKAVDDIKQLFSIQI